MARITVEDCIDKYPDRFELILLAAYRAKMLHSGSYPAVEINNDKNTVLALRELAEEAISAEDVKESLIHSLQKHVEVDEPDAEDFKLIGAQGSDTEEDSKSFHITESDLLKGIQGLAPPDKSDTDY